MPTTRLLRYTLSGSSFILFSVLFFLLFGGTINLDGLTVDTDSLVKIAALILSTPLLGIVISTIVFQSLVCLIGYKTYYYIPESLKIIRWILKETDTTTSDEVELRNMVEQSDTKSRRFSKKFYPFYQIKVRKHVKGRSLSFLERKWAVIWIHRNIIGSITIASSLNAILWIFTFFKGNCSGLLWEFDIYKIILLLIILLYVLLANSHVKYSLKVATDFEHKILMNAYDKEITTSNSKENQSWSFLGLLINLFRK